MTLVSVDQLILSDESGFACSKAKLVQIGVPHLRPFNISNSGTLDLTELYQVPISEAPLSKSVLEEGDILFNNTNSAELVGKSALIGSRMSVGFSNHMTRIRVNRSLVEPAFFAYWLRRLRRTGFFTAHATQWVSQAAYKSSELRKLCLKLPPLHEQRRIADILSRAEGIIRLRREAGKKAAEIIPALFIDMFGDPITNPKGWRIENLDSVTQIISGVTKGRQLNPSETIELPYMRVANVKDGYLDLADIKTIAVRDKEIEKYKLLPGDLLMTEGGDPDKLGRAAIWKGELDLCLHQNHIFKVRPDSDHLLPEYLRELVGSSYGKAYFLRVAKKTTGIATINRTQLGNFPVLIPPIEKQNEFVEKFDSVCSIHYQQIAALKKAEATFSALLAKFFTP
jgi:type I restriction enzyme S subunit